MKNLFKHLVPKSIEASRNYPIEILVSLLFSIVGMILEVSGESIESNSMLLMFPVIFMLIFTLNELTLGKKDWRFVYIFSFLLFVPFAFINVDVDSSIYTVSIIVAQLIYIVSRHKTENDDFVKDTVQYVLSLAKAAVIALVVFLSLMAIFFSIQYIFEIWKGSEIENHVVTCFAYFAFMLVAPLLMLMFRKNDEPLEAGHRLVNVLLNWVLTPALLIYSVILYLYFIKIAATWSLPKGMIAYMAIGFVSVLFLLKGTQVFLTKKYFERLFHWASVAAIPVLVMLWIAAFYRINQYGYTEMRVYLLVVAVVLTGMTMFFFFRKTARFYYVLWLAIGLTAVITYIPGITAKQIEKASQKQIAVNRPARETPKTITMNLFVKDSETNHSIDISGYDQLYRLDRFNSNGFRVSIKDTLKLYKDNKVIFSLAEDELVKRQMTKAGLADLDSIPDSAKESMLKVDVPQGVIVLSDMTLESNKGKYRITDYSPYCLLIKQTIQSGNENNKISSSF